jgi:AcrR family transcriptional regulator
MVQKRKTKPKMGRPLKLEGEKDTREKIIEASIDLFSKNGFGRTSVRQIASAIGLTEGAVYKHFTSKNAILDEVFVYAQNFIYTPLPIEQTLGALQGMSIFRGLLAPLPEIIMAEPTVAKIMQIIFHEMNHNENIRHYYQKEYIERGDNYISELFEKCIETGTIRACNTLALAKVFNSYRAEWSFQNFIIKQDKPVELSKLQEELEVIILFFEEMMLPNKNEIKK